MYSLVFSINTYNYNHKNFNFSIQYNSLHSKNENMSQIIFSLQYTVPPIEKRKTEFKFEKKINDSYPTFFSIRL